MIFHVLVTVIGFPPSTQRNTVRIKTLDYHWEGRGLNNENENAQVQKEYSNGVRTT